MKQIKMILEGAAECAVPATAGEGERASAAMERAYPELMEKGFEGKDWIRMWLEEQQIYGDVEQGNRNNVLAQMVKDMRYVFGSAEELKEALPD